MVLLPTLSLNEQYKDRLDSAWESLAKDVQRWQKIVPSGTTIAHHISEFERFRVNAYEALVPPYQYQSGAKTTAKAQEAGGPALDAEDFRALVIGVLTAHWSLLRQVASQRIAGSPYSAALPKLDELSVAYYHRARNALPTALQQHVKASAPLIHLGNIGMITVFNQNVPLVLSVPYNVIDSDAPNDSQLTEAAKKSQLAIPHEIGHAILIQLPELAQELRRRLTANEQKLTKRQEILAQTIAGWIDELLADMIGTALAGNAFAASAIWITASSENNVGIADEQHPPNVTRPFVHLKVIEYLHGREASPRRAEQISEIKSITEPPEALREQFLAQTVGDRLGRQFRSIPALTFMKLEEVKEALQSTVDELLDPKSTLDSLDGGTLGDFLFNCSSGTAAFSPVDKPYEWGEIPPGQLDQYALAMPTGARTDFYTPWTVSSGICDYLPWLPICRG